MKGKTRKAGAGIPDVLVLAVMAICALSSDALAYVFPYDDGHVTGDCTTIELTIPQAICAQLCGTVRLKTNQEKRLGFRKSSGTNVVVAWRHFDARESKAFCCCSHPGLQLSNIGLLDDMRHLVIPQGLPDRIAGRGTRGVSYFLQYAFCVLLLVVLALVLILVLIVRFSTRRRRRKKKREWCYEESFL